MSNGDREDIARCFKGSAVYIHSGNLLFFLRAKKDIHCSTNVMYLAIRKPNMTAQLFLPMVIIPPTAEQNDFLLEMGNICLLNFSLVSRVSNH